MKLERFSRLLIVAKIAAGLFKILILAGIIGLLLWIFNITLIK